MKAAVLKSQVSNSVDSVGPSLTIASSHAQEATGEAASSHGAPSAPMQLSPDMLAKIGKMLETHGLSPGGEQSNAALLALQQIIAIPSAQGGETQEQKNLYGPIHSTTTRPAPFADNAAVQDVVTPPGKGKGGGKVSEAKESVSSAAA